MSPSSITDEIVREVPLVRADTELLDAVKTLIEAQVPALPVIDSDDRLVGIFGEREFIGAIFPGYLGALQSAGFIRRATEEVLEKRAECATEPVSKYTNTEHIDVSTDYSDAQVAEIFLHHRVLIVPIVEERRVKGIITRWDFFKALAERLPPG